MRGHVDYLVKKEPLQFDYTVDEVAPNNLEDSEETLSNDYSLNSEFVGVAPNHMEVQIKQDDLYEPQALQDEFVEEAY